MKERLDKLLEECKKYTAEGQVASYIPELAKARREDLGIYIINQNEDYFMCGDWNKKFTIQSISKPLVLLMAIMDNGIENIVKRVGVEATGKPFNAIDYSEQLILSENINPMVNIGAIAMCSLIRGKTYEEKFERLLDFTRIIANNDNLDVDEGVYQSEKATGDKNRALAFLLKSSGVINDDIDKLMEVYFKMCSINVTCKDLAEIAFLLANHGYDASKSKQIIPKEYARFVNAILSTCGMYDGSGDFAIRVGIPAKSGVGGGIMAVAPGKMGIGIFSPALDKKGNSLAGIKLIEKISQELELSIY